MKAEPHTNLVALAQSDEEMTGPIEEPSEVDDAPDGDELEDSDAPEDDDDKAGAL